MITPVTDLVACTSSPGNAEALETKGQALHGMDSGWSRVDSVMNAEDSPLSDVFSS